MDQSSALLKREPLVQIQPEAPVCVVELVDTTRLGRVAARHGGSSPLADITEKVRLVEDTVLKTAGVDSPRRFDSCLFRLAPLAQLVER